jgi:hypothetical protein
MSVASYKGVGAVFICAEDQFRVAFEQRRNFADVAFPGSVVNLAAEGETTPKQSDQGDSSGAVRNGEINSPAGCRISEAESPGFRIGCGICGRYSEMASITPSFRDLFR